MLIYKGLLESRLVMCQGIKDGMTPHSTGHTFDDILFLVQLIVLTNIYMVLIFRHT